MRSLSGSGAASNVRPGMIRYPAKGHGYLWEGDRTYAGWGILKGSCGASQGSKPISFTIRGTAIALRGKRNTRELLIRYALLSQPAPISLALTGLSAGHLSSTSEAASSA